MQYHILISRINPALKIDLARFCTIVDGQAKAFTVDEFRQFCKDSQLDSLSEIFSVSEISDSMYIRHSDLSALIQALMTTGPITVDYFDNNFVIVFNYGTEKKEDKE